MIDLREQTEHIRHDLRQRRAERARLDLSTRQRRDLPRMEAAQIERMRRRLDVEISELERYIIAMGG
jgi:hypothetical protein